MNRKKFLTFLLFFYWEIGFSQNISKDSIRQSLMKSLVYLQNSQTKQTIIGKQYAGEWEATMGMKLPFVMLGGKSRYRDSNCFTMAGIHNILAELYLADTTQKQILPMLQKVFPEVMSYGTFDKKYGWKFNFWKALPPNRDLKKNDKLDNGLVRRPTTFRLKNRFINNAANVENDADDTSMGNLAIWYQQQIFGKDSLKIASSKVFEKWVDADRENRNWYNYLFHGFSKSGAYLTWLAQEEEFDDWNFGKTFFHNVIFFLPQSICFPHAYKPYIPWGTNDVDAVVNANVLTYLYKTNQRGKSVKNANKFIENHAKRGRWNKTTVYYPNRYHFHYAVSRALVSGDKGLEQTGKYLLEDLLKTQKGDGHFESIKRVNKKDILQSTVYAFVALMYLKEAGFEVPKEKVDMTVSFIEENKNNNYWKGGVFFSGGTIVRSMLYFTSDAYTTSLVALGYEKYLRLF